jgi:hypothetical protein
MRPAASSPLCVFGLAVVLALAAASCARTARVEGPADGYFELYQGGTYYITSTLAAQDRIKDGKLPTRTMRTRAPQGQLVIVEDDGMGLGDYLMAQYQRRHPRDPGARTVGGQ